MMSEAMSGETQYSKELTTSSASSVMRFKKSHTHLRIVLGSTAPLNPPEGARTPSPTSSGIDDGVDSANSLHSAAIMPNNAVIPKVNAAPNSLR